VTDFTFYPNPVSQFLTVHSKSNPVVITDLYGREFAFSGNEKTDVSALTSGIYFIKSGNKVKKFIKE